MKWLILVLLLSIQAFASDTDLVIGRYAGTYKGSRGFLKSCYLKVEPPTADSRSRLYISFFKKKSKFSTSIILNSQQFVSMLENVDEKNPYIAHNELQTNFSRKVCQVLSLNCEEGHEEHRVFFDAKKNIVGFEYLKNNETLIHCNELEKRKSK